MPKQLLYDIELWMSGKLQDIDDTLKAGLTIYKNYLKVGAIEVEDTKFLKSRIIELLQSKGKYLVCKIDRIKWFNKGMPILIVDSEKIDRVFKLTDKEFEISSYDHALPFSIINNGKGHWLIEGFEDRASAELFIEMGGFDNE